MMMMIMTLNLARHAVCTSHRAITAKKSTSTNKVLMQLPKEEQN